MCKTNNEIVWSRICFTKPEVVKLIVELVSPKKPKG